MVLTLNGMYCQPFAAWPPAHVNVEKRFPPGITSPNPSLKQSGDREIGGAAFAAYTGAGQQSIDAVAEAWLKSPHGKMAIDIHGGREEAKKFWIELQQEGKSDA